MSKSLIYITFILLLITGCKRLDNIANSTITDTNHTPIKYVFPFDWVGFYEGELMIISNFTDTSFVNMQLDIGFPNASGFYPWTITYGENDIRSYGLEAINPDKGHYRIDEFNSIKIDGFIRGNHFISRFSVMDSDMLIDYEKLEGGINVSLYITGNNDYYESGGEVIGDSKVPLVNSYRVNVFQKAFLKQIER